MKVAGEQDFRVKVFMLRIDQVQGLCCGKNMPLWYVVVHRKKKSPVYSERTQELDV